MLEGARVGVAASLPGGARMASAFRTACDCLSNRLTPLLIPFRTPYLTSLPMLFRTTCGCSTGSLSRASSLSTWPN